MRRALGLCALLLWPAKVLAQGAIADSLFRWGEYDSLIAVLEPWTASHRRPTTRADSAAASRSLQRLGVAYYASGRADETDSAFARACRLGCDLGDDRFYVTDEIVARLESARRAEERRRHPEPAGAPAPAAAAMPTGASLKPRDGSRAWIWWGAAAGVAAAAGGVYMLTAEPERQVSETVIDARTP